MRLLDLSLNEQVRPLIDRHRHRYGLLGAEQASRDKVYAGVTMSLLLIVIGDARQALERNLEPVWFAVDDSLMDTVACAY